MYTLYSVTTVRSLNYGQVNQNSRSLCQTKYYLLCFSTKKYDAANPNELMRSDYRRFPANFEFCVKNNPNSLKWASLERAEDYSVNYSFC